MRPDSDSTRPLRCVTYAAVLIGLALAGGPAGASDLIERLRAGGLVVAFSAPQATHPDDHDPTSASDCRQPRALSPVGQRDAKALGDGYRNQELEFEQIFSSTGCRARHSAFLAFGADWVAYRDALATGCDSEPGKPLPGLRNLTRLRPPAGRNHLLFTQVCNLQRDVSGREGLCGDTPLQPGDAVIYDPTHDGRPIACIRLAQWRAWADRPHWSERLDPSVSFPFRRNE